MVGDHGHFLSSYISEGYNKLENNVYPALTIMKFKLTPLLVITDISIGSLLVQPNGVKGIDTTRN